MGRWEGEERDGSVWPRRRGWGREAGGERPARPQLGGGLTGPSRSSKRRCRAAAQHRQHQMSGPMGGHPAPSSALGRPLQPRPAAVSTADPLSQPQARRSALARLLRPLSVLPSALDTFEHLQPAAIPTKTNSNSDTKGSPATNIQHQQRRQRRLSGIDVDAARRSPALGISPSPVVSSSTRDAMAERSSSEAPGPGPGAASSPTPAVPSASSVNKFQDAISQWRSTP